MKHAAHHGGHLIMTILATSVWIVMVILAFMVLTLRASRERARMKRKELAVYVAAAAAICFFVAPALPDSIVGSPRSITFALGGGLLAAAGILRGRA
jgi:heme/copper-type cytochrome/quinol oxidase subunit 2